MKDIPETRIIEIAVDLDGTLAYYDHWRGIDHIGEPILPMLTRVKDWLNEGKKVSIFTARATDAEAITYVKNWLVLQGIGGLDVTNIKRKEFSEFWDDRAFHVIKNTGQALARPRATEAPVTLQPIGPIKLITALDNQVGGDHYQHLVIKPSEYCRKNKLLGMESAVVKYVSRHDHKGGALDIRKAINCLETILEMDYADS